MKENFEKIALLVLESKKFKFSETELTDLEISHFSYLMHSHNVKQYKLEFSKSVFDEIHFGLFKVLDIDTPTTWETLNNYLKEYLTYFGIEINNTYPPEELHVKGVLQLILDCQSDKIKVVDIYDGLNPVLKFGVLKTCFGGYLNTEEVLKFIEKFQLDYQKATLHRCLFENVEVEKYILNCKLLEVLEFIVKVNQPKYDVLLNILLWEMIKFDPRKGFDIINRIEKEERYNPLIINSLRSLNSSVENFGHALDIILNGDKTILAEKTLTLATFSQKIIDNELQLRIKNEITTILKIGGENEVHAFLNYLDWFKFEEIEKLELLKLVVNNPNLTDRVIKKNQSNYCELDHSLAVAIKDPFLVLKFFIYFSHHSKHTFEPKDFEFSIVQIIIPNLEKLKKELGLLLIENIGKSRKLGFSLIEYFINQEIEINLENFILDLDEDEEIKLILTVNVPFSNNPFEMLKITLPILKKNTQLSLLQIIGFATEKFTNYKEIIPYFEMYLENTENLTLVKNLFENNQNYRESILKNNQQFKYFDSELIFYQYFNLYEKYWQNNMNKIFNNIQNEGLIKFFSKKRLLKGGGYKFSEKTNINKLSHIQSKVTIPHEAFLNYDQRTFDTVIFFSENWTDNNVWEKWMKKF